ncbi:MAG: radical SAM protein [Desulfosporosinus sp.]|jgi:biotin synthase
MDKSIKNIVDKAMNRNLLSALEIRNLLALPLDSEEAFYIRYAALQLNKEVMGGRAEIHGQVGVNSGPCARNCAFCSFAACNRVFKEQRVEAIEGIIEKCVRLQAEGANAIYLMATATLSFADFLNMGRLVRSSLEAETILIANIEDFGIQEAIALKEVGFNGVYHAVRLGEGKDTRISMQKRLETIAAVHKAGLKLGTCVEPVGPEHSLDEIVEKTLLTREMHPVFSGAMRRIPIPNTGLSPYGKTSEARMAHIVAVVRLATGYEVAGNCTHEPNVLGVTAGANLLWAETGSNPRDTKNDTASGRGFDMARCREILSEADIGLIQGPSRMFTST